MKILVIFTGGTIGSTEGNGYIGPREKSAYRLLSLYHAYRDSSGMEHGDIVFDTAEPYSILSENSTGEVLQRLAGSVRAGLLLAERENYAGVIVTHGTDTLAWSAAMLGFLFADSRIPVVMVSSNYILEDPRTNGLSNFAYAVEFICQRPAGGVYVSYRNAGGVPRIHLGTRLLAHQAYSDAVESLGGAVAWFKEGGLYIEDGRLYTGDGTRGEAERLHRKDGSAREDEKQESASGVTWNRPEFKGIPSWDAPILQIYPSPGMHYPQIPAGTQSILHHTYHSGTIGSDTPGITSFFAEARKRQIPVFLAGAGIVLPNGTGGEEIVPPAGEKASCSILRDVKKDYTHLYESTRIFEEYSIRVLPAASPVAMYIKLWLLLGSGLDPTEWMERDIAGEMIN